MFKKANKNAVRKAKHDRIRNDLRGTKEQPRLNVYRSTTHIYAQIIDDAAGKTLCSASSLDKELAGKLEGKTKAEVAYEVGKLVGSRAKKLKIKKVVFDRGGYIYTGRVQRLAEGARDAGLEF
ncbi:MAG: 50S ribosomal protein L18 [Clostridia bacterium]|nr:50S ribosomal protein L18 [Clostridia bacterium]